MRTLLVEYNGRVCTSVLRGFASDSSGDTPEPQGGDKQRIDRRALHILLTAETSENNGTLREGDVYGPRTTKFTRKDLVRKSSTFRTALLLHLKSARATFSAFLERLCKAHSGHRNVRPDRPTRSGVEYDTAICAMTHHVAKSLAGACCYHSSFTRYITLHLTRCLLSCRAVRHAVGVTQWCALLYVVLLLSLYDESASL